MQDGLPPRRRMLLLCKLVALAAVVVVVTVKSLATARGRWRHCRPFGVHAATATGTTTKHGHQALPGGRDPALFCSVPTRARAATELTVLWVALAVEAGS